MAAALDLVTFDGPDPVRAAAFWGSVLGLHETEREDDGRWIVLSSADGTRRVGLQHGTARPGGVHLDLVCGADEFESEVARIVALGATLVSPARRESYGWIVNLVDPDGYAVDLCAYA